MKASELTPEERWLYAPWHVKLLSRLAIAALPFLCCLQDVSF